MIEIRSLTKVYKAAGSSLFALKDINFSVKPGQIFGIIGRSGAGKSSLVRCIDLLETPSSGHVFIDGEDLTRLSRESLRLARQKISMVFQHFNLLSTKTVAQNVALALIFHSTPKKERSVRVLELLSWVGLSDKADAYPSQLSGGQKQRVAIARALAVNPHVLLCDEMTSSLDPETTASILSLLKSLTQRLNIAVILITHEMEVIQQIADVVGVMDQGELVEQGRVVDVFHAPEHPVTQALIRRVLHLDLPSTLAGCLQAVPDEGLHPVVRIRFVGDVSQEPILHEMTEKFSVKMNILQANLEFLQSVPMGVMLVSVEGGPASIAELLLALNAKTLKAEIIGYLPV